MDLQKIESVLQQYYCMKHILMRLERFLILSQSAGRFPSGFSRSCIVSCWGSYIASSRNGGSKSHRVHLLLLKKIHRRVIHLTCSSHPTAPIHSTAMWWLSR